MSDNYFQVTVQPLIPIDFLTEKEIRFLEASGFTVEAEKTWQVDKYVLSGEYYLFAGESLDMDAELTIERLEYDGEEGWDGYSVASILQNVIRRSNGTIPEIILKGAYTCSKMAPNQFGGYCCRITKNFVQEGGTSQLIEWFRKNEGKELCL